ncbi:holo-[acyl-carrier-protein] synthase [Candidatus Daviesbacteria bacterium RIFCSPLOWO2_02_FULL_36_7]|uniref:Holo-[acyl-carrier-protein] synthase n=1 Tax=Candidatus Daviesbacteria bacterium RIFCSPLOWO2_02_FULL_36_7 TaxID=1797792 RepID=A0A1F5MHJ4_9BACT|nr:MAG: holo-[acyl-carrier-protein] synthase [Candidatus Daviesbacteria bacterium RIFCSPLOWO2_02_FULL_36_7]
MKKNQILGIGIDIENINRFEKLKLSKNNRFLNKIFTKVELDYCFSKKNLASNLTTKFAGKEAVIKACNVVDKTTVDYKKIEITNNPSGAPKVRLISDQGKKYEILISLSNDTDRAVGVAIVTEA